MKGKRGKIMFPRGVRVYPHEMRVAAVLASYGLDIVFIPTSNIPRPDIRFEGREWEIKSPIGKSKRSIEGCIRGGLRQSENVIIDLSRIQMPQEKAIREVRRQNALVKGKHRIMIVTRGDKIIKLF